LNLFKIKKATTFIILESFVFKYKIINVCLLNV